MVRAFNCAIVNGNVDTLKSWYDLYGDVGMAYFTERKWTDSACTKAAARGHLPMLQYLHSNGFCWNAETTENAATNGHLDCLQYLHENGCRWNERTCRWAVINAHVNCLQYAHENGCPWQSADVYPEIATSLACLQYLHEHGYPWSPNTCTVYATGRKLDCLVYAHKHGAPWDNVQTVYRHIIRYNYIAPVFSEILQYMRDYCGCLNEQTEQTEEHMNGTMKLLCNHDDIMTARELYDTTTN